ncbi:MAG: hypothetical protein ACLTZW_00600 [Paratractidigestivibacter faecalis]
MTAAVCALSAFHLGFAALCLALPLAWVLLLRGGHRQGAPALARGCAGIALGVALALVALAACLGTPALATSAAPALLAVCAAAWLPIAVDYATLTAEAPTQTTAKRKV